MAIRDDFTAGEVLAAADLNDTFADKLPIGGGKVLQVVRATDTTNRSTTSTSYVDVTGMSVTITPQRSTSAIIILATTKSQVSVSTPGRGLAQLQITDSSDNTISGAQEANFGVQDLSSTHWQVVNLFGYATPATTSAVTYKLRFRVFDAGRTVTIINGEQTGQLFAIEVSA
jgi:hypothetical protein